MFVQFSQKTATLALHSISRLVLYNRGRECLLCAVRTKSL